MPHRLKISFKSGVRTIELDGEEISTINVIKMEIKSPGISLESIITPTTGSFTCNVTATEGEVEFVIPDQVAAALT